MEEYLAALRDRIITAFRREGTDGNQTTRYEIYLNSGQRIDGGLVRHTEATFTVQTMRGPLGNETLEMEIPYLAVSAIQRYWTRE